MKYSCFDYKWHLATADLLCARTHSKFFTCGSLYGHHSNPIRKALLLYPYSELSKLEMMVWIRVAGGLSYEYILKVEPIGFGGQLHVGW